MGLPPALRMWLHERIKGRLARDLPTLRICLGPNGSYIAIDSTGYIIWGEEMDTALIALRELRKGGWKQYPRILALGHGGQFAMITNKNVGCWDPNLCPQITEILDTCTMKSIQVSPVLRMLIPIFRSVDWPQNIALNPWNPAHFILQTTDDQVFVGGLSPSLRERADAFADSLVRSRRRAEEAKRKAEEENDNNYLMELGRRRHDRAEMRLLSQKEIKDNQLRYERARRLADSVSSQVIQAKYRPKTSSQLGMMANGKLFNLGVHML